MRRQNGLLQRINVVAVHRDSLPAERMHPIHHRLRVHHVFGPALDLLTVDIHKDDKVIQAVERGCLEALPGLTLLQLAVGEHDTSLLSIGSLPEPSAVCRQMQLFFAIDIYLIHVFL